MSRRPKVEREKISFRESVELAQDYWDGFAGGDAFGLPLVLLPVTSIWYWLRGAPVARREAAASRRRQSWQTSQLGVVATYAIGIIGLVFLVGVVVGIIVFVV